MYATASDITKRYSAEELLIVSDRNSDGVSDTDIIDQALSDATSEIEAYLGTRYDLPLTSVPAVFTRICVDIAMYRMSENAVSLTEERRRRYEDSITFLKDVSMGKVTIGILEPTEASPNAVTYSTDARVWTRDKTSGLF